MKKDKVSQIEMVGNDDLKLINAISKGFDTKTNVQNFWKILKRMLTKKIKNLPYIPLINKDDITNDLKTQVKSFEDLKHLCDIIYKKLSNLQKRGGGVNNNSSPPYGHYAMVELLDLYPYIKINIIKLQNEYNEYIEYIGHYDENTNEKIMLFKRNINPEIYNKIKNTGMVVHIGKYYPNVEETFKKDNKDNRNMSLKSYQEDKKNNESFNVVLFPKGTFSTLLKELRIEKELQYKTKNSFLT